MHNDAVVVTAARLREKRLLTGPDTGAGGIARNISHAS